MRSLYLTVLVSAAVLGGCSSHNSSNSANGADSGAFTAGLGNGDGSAMNGNNDYYLGNSYSTRAPEDQKYYFAFDKDEVHSEYMASIAAQAQYMSAHPHARIRLEGNTDIQGSREYNIGLGDRRARAIANVMQSHGTSSKQLSIISFGAEKPVASGRDEASYHLNRRVDLRYDAKE